MVKRCGCLENISGNKNGAKYQNEKYGKGMRVHNPFIKNNQKQCRCTVCGSEKNQ